jgi:arsenate reductase (thioredoxin)
MAEKQVLFVCVENACRSLMAEAMFNVDPPPGWHAISAGTRPAGAPHLRTERMLGEIGLKVPGHPPQLLTPEMIEDARIRVSMGCLDDASCPVRLAQAGTRDWELPDPSQLDDEGFRQVRNRIGELVRGLRVEISLSERRKANLTRSSAK